MLQVEERPFLRVTKSLLGKDSLLRWTPPKQLPSPPPDGGEADAHDTDDADDVSKRKRFREEVLLDFAALESSIMRIQLIQSSNARERQRYAAEKAKILETAQAVKHNTLELRTQLAEAQRVLELRKGYDELATKLIDPKKLKPRAETREDIIRLEKEIEELQQESADYETTWVGRREAFERVVSEGQAMMRVVKGIKDEPEQEVDKDERMEDGEEGEHGLKGERSRLASPAPEMGGRTPMLGRSTPLPDHGGETPRSRTNAPDGIRSSSQVGTPLLQAYEEDVDMKEEDQVATLAGIEELQEPREPPAKTTAGIEFTEDQVATPAEGMEGDGEEEVKIAEESALHVVEKQLSQPAEVMDET